MALSEPRDWGAGNSVIQIVTVEDEPTEVATGAAGWVTAPVGALLMIIHPVHAYYYLTSADELTAAGYEPDVDELDEDPDEDDDTADELSHESPITGESETTEVTA